MNPFERFPVTSIGGVNALKAALDFMAAMEKLEHMNIDTTYNRPLRIISKPGDTRGFMVYLYDAETEEAIHNVKAATIYLNADGVNTVELTYYARDEHDHIVTGLDRKAVMRTITIESDKHEVDLSVWEI